MKTQESKSFFLYYFLLKRYDQGIRKDENECGYNQNMGYVRCLDSILFWLTLNYLFIIGNLQCARILFHTNVNYGVCLHANILCSYISSITYLKNWGLYFYYIIIFNVLKLILFSFTFQACERAIDVDNEFITSEIDSSYPQCSKDSVLNNTLSETPQTTLYELLEYAKSRSILRNNIQNSTSNSHPSGFSIRSMNSVHFNQHSQNFHLQPLSCENSSLKTNKKVPIRISSLKRESKTAQTLR